MADHTRSHTTADLYRILRVPVKDLCKGFMKWNPSMKSPRNMTPVKERDKSHSENEPYIVTTPTTPNLDESFFANISRTFSRTNSRRSKTPSPSPRSLSRNSSQLNSTTDRLLSRNTSRRSPRSTPIIYSQSTALKKPPPVEKKLECTLEELCDGCVKKIMITRDAIVNGIIVEEEEMLKIEVKPGWKKGTKITFEGKGDEKPGYLPADITFSIDERRHPLFSRDGDDLELGVEIPLVNALTGCSIPVPLLGGDKMSLSFDTIIYPGFQKVIMGQGMPIPTQPSRKGDLRIQFLVKFPSELSEEQRAEAATILQDCS
ncbi:dnaJ homolog subfamily B member 4-like [Cucurbita moschata]|uniref:DnaJ homolog subfamily B member 4-like n=1 Tax=Cucurbita moschata TaxID=3662 RepID=A0A6J1HKZ1_CUCMO|nr:dnaJ homolog subfamily B member 4-like [Cucurbita moschata]